MSNEQFYFDRRDSVFFSILATDYFLFDEDLNVSLDTTSDYAPEVMAALAERIRGIEAAGDSIVELPRLGDIGANQDFFARQLRDFLERNDIDLERATLWVPAGGRIQIDL